MYAITCRKPVAVSGKTTFSDEESKFCTYTQCSKKEGKWEYSILPNAKLTLDNSPVAVVVHGFNNTFEDALDMGERFTQIYQIQVIVFSWPSAGQVINYFSDEKKASDSSIAFASALKTISENVVNTTIKVSLMFHSMGNRLFKHYIQTLEKERGYFDFLQNIALVEADVASEGHEIWCKWISPKARTFVILNQFDYALEASSLIHKGKRLGDCVTNLVSKAVTYIDLTGAVYDSHDPFYLNAPQVHQVFTNLLRSEDPTRGLTAKADSDNIFALKPERDLCTLL